MSIIKAIDRAYEQMIVRGYENIYWCIDLHGTCIKSNYQNGDYEWINGAARNAIRDISTRPESVIILWSSVYRQQQEEIIEFFRKSDIQVDFFNENPLEGNTETGDFSKKFYMSILIDDKAGFDPDEDWLSIYEYLYPN